MYVLRLAYVIFIFLPAQAQFHVERSEKADIDDVFCEDTDDSSLSLLQRRSRARQPAAKTVHKTHAAKPMSAIASQDKAVGEKGKLAVGETEKIEDDAGPTFSAMTMESEALTVDVVSLAVVLPALIWAFASNSQRKEKKEEEDARAVKDPKKGYRSALIDNARFLAMLSVVMGQCFLSSRHSQHDGLFSATPSLQSSMFYAPAAFNVPSFCIISGILSQGPPSAQRLRHLFVYTVVPYLFYIFVLQPLIVIPLSVLSLQTYWDQLNEYLSMNPLASFRNNVDRWGPPYNPWYLYALICWRGTAMFFARFSNSSLFFACSILLGAFSGYLKLDALYFQFGKVFAHMPYFAIGFVFPLDSMCQGCSPNNGLFIIAACLVVIASLFVTSIYGRHWGYELVHEGFWTYASTHPPEAFDDRSFYLLWLRRLSKIVLDSVGVAALLMLIPRRKMLFTWVGKYSIFVFLLHGVTISWRALFVHTANYQVLSGWSDYLAGFTVHLFLSLATCVFFASRPVRFLVGWAIEPTWLDILSQHVFGSRVPDWKLIAEQKKLASEQFEWQKPASICEEKPASQKGGLDLFADGDETIKA